VVNVKDFGAKGDGVTDDTVAIQAALDVGGGKLVFFPDGVYIVSTSLITSATDSEKVFIELGSATIKASDTFTGEWLLILGGKGSATSYANTVHINGIRGGELDANSKCNGLLSQWTHLARIQDINVVNVTHVGVQIDESNNGSADAYVQNVMISGTHTLDSVGLYVNAHDCDVENVRSRSCYVGVRALKGGMLSNCHPIFGLMDETYDRSIGFDIINAHLDNCYSDNFSTAFQNSASSAMWQGSNLTAFWYTNTDHNHTVIKNTASNSLLCDIDGLGVDMPTLGKNRGIWTPAGKITSYSWSTYNRQRLRGVRGYEGSFVNYLDGVADPMFQSSILGIDTQYLRNDSDTAAIVVGKWYPLIVLPGLSAIETFIFDVTFQNNVAFELAVSLSESSFSIKSIDQYRNNANASMSFGAKKHKTSANVVYWVVYYRVDSKDEDDMMNESAVTLKTKTLKHYFYALPRPAYNYDSAFNGQDSIDGLVIADYALIAHGTIRATESCLLKQWQKEWHIPMHSGKTQERITIHLAFGSHNAMYVYFAGRVAKVFSTGTGESVTYNAENREIIVTTPSSGVVNVVYG
jgi:hypothetical protein